MAVEKSAYSIDEFCLRNGICRGSLYSYWRRGIGPRCMKIGARRLITANAEKDWHREREQAEYERASRERRVIDDQ